MGSALAFVAADAGSKVQLIGTPVDKDVIDACLREGRHPAMDEAYPAGTGFSYCDGWKEAVEGCDFVIAAVSSFGVEWFMEEILCSLSPAIPVLSAAKGLICKEDGALLSYPAHWQEELAANGVSRDIYALGGPGTAPCIRRKDHTMVALCGPDPEVLLMMKGALSTDYFHISLTRDIEGLEMAVAIKNAYALGISMALGHERSRDAGSGKECFNSQAAVFYQASREMNRLLELHSAGQLSRHIGSGDLFVTVTGARTRQIGLLLGEGKSYSEAVEILGGITLESVVIVHRLQEYLRIKEERGEMDGKDFPFLRYIIRVLDGDKVGELPWKEFEMEEL